MTMYVVFDYSSRLRSSLVRESLLDSHGLLHKDSAWFGTCSFKGFHGHHSGEHGSRQGGMVLGQEVRGHTWDTNLRQRDTGNVQNVLKSQSPHACHIYSNTATPSNLSQTEPIAGSRLFKDMNLWRSFLFKPPQDSTALELPAEELGGQRASSTIGDFDE